MGKILCYIYEEKADFEISLLLHRLKNAGAREIISISETTAPVTAQSGLTYIPDRAIEDIVWAEASASSEDRVSLADVEALIIPGGPINNEQNGICPLARTVAEQGKLLAAICFAPQFLGRAGILDSYQYTTSCSEAKIAQLGCADPFNRENYLFQRTVVDRNVITAQGYAFVDFALEVCRYLKIFTSPEQEYDQLVKIKAE
ncbi:MAG: DJ-1/PfpI family protein [Lachnospiraceae bacterium]|nr:DJ-1/PfpI family protein [Lachnospiraceae bacterium]